MVARSPRSLAVAHLQELSHHLPGVKDGESESVHQARVATRRLREVLPLFGALHPREIEGALDTVRAAGRELGRVRELDVMHELLMREETRVPAAAAVTAVARRGLSAQREKARRKLIKALERIEFDRVGDMLPRLASRWEEMRERYTSVGRWRRPLLKRLADRSSKLRSAVHHATGVYLPNRLHQARIAAKKLRYTAEVACATGAWRPAHLLRDLKRIQDTLGELHDLQVLSDELEDLVGDSTVRGEIPLLTSALRGEAVQHHQKYLARRKRLLAICDACDRFAGAWRVRPSEKRHFRSLVAASALAIPAGVVLLAQRHDGGRLGDSSRPAGTPERRQFPESPPPGPNHLHRVEAATAGAVGRMAE